MKIDNNIVEKAEKERTTQATAPSEKRGSSDKTSAVNGLYKLLADSYALLIKTHNYHWNATGPNFYSFHKLTEEKYTELFTSIDDIAEKVRSLGEKVPASMKHFNDLSDVVEPNFQLSINDMILDIVHTNKAIARDVQKMIPNFESSGRKDIVDFLTARLSWHSKTEWLFKSMLIS